MLRLKNITKDYGGAGNTVHALKGISLDFRKNEFVSILGQSGCGKTTLLNIIGGLDKYTSGDLEICGVSTKNFTDGDWDVYRNHRIGFVFQSYNLIPHQTILGNVEIALTIAGVSKAERKKRAAEALKRVGLEKEMNKKPNQLSGGQMQRVAIARALVNSPEILLADEPTTALDVTIQAQILELMQDLQKKLGMAVILVTHDLGVIADMCDNIIVMYGGRICERGTAREIFYNPKHEYTKGLLRSIPNVNNMKKKLVPIAGTPINMLNLPAGCAFCTRCDAAMKICLSEHPEEMAINENHRAACWINVRDQLMAEGGEQNV